MAAGDKRLAPWWSAGVPNDIFNTSQEWDRWSIIVYFSQLKLVCRRIRW